MKFAGLLIGAVSLALGAADSPDAVEIAAWEAALSTGDAVNLELFFAKYPNGVFSSEAEA